MLHGWAIVLAGGEGSRLRALATDDSGRPAPKQFCPLGGERPPLAAALERAEHCVARERVVVSVVEAQRCWWAAQLGDRPPGTVISQPRSRGTAVGVLHPLLSIVERDPEARVLVLPADHAVDDEAILREGLERAMWVARRRTDAVVLLGVTPTRADADLGWILPSDDRDADSDQVAAFLEKPGPERARQVMASGGMWNAFLIAAKAATVHEIYRRHLPELLSAETGLRPNRPGAARDARAESWESLPSRDFSRDLLAPAVAQLRVVRVPPCGWTDLGTPARLHEWLASRRGPIPTGQARLA